MTNQQSNTHILALVGGILIIALTMPLFMGGGNVPTGDGLNLVDKAFQVIFNNTGTNPEYNVTADQEVDTLEFIAGTGMLIDVDSANDRITFSSSAPGGGEANTASNIGGGEGVFAQKVFEDLEFKSLTTAGDGIVLTGNSDNIQFSLNSIPKSEVALTGSWVKSELPADTVYTGDSQTITSKTISASANTLSGIGFGEVVADIISGQTEDGSPDGAADYVLTYDADVASLKKVLLNNLPGGGGGEANTASNVGTGVGVFDNKDGVDLEFNSLIGGTGIDITDTVQDLTIAIDGTVLTSSSSIHDLGNVTNSGCADNEILKVSSGVWVCAVDGGSGINDINGDSSSSQTLLGTTNQVTVTDTGAGELTFDVGTDVVQVDQANTYTNGNLQTFADDDIRIGDLSNDHYAVFSVNEFAADRTITIPALGTNEVFVFQGVSQTLTNKGIDADSNTITNVDNDEIKAGAGIDWTKISKSGSSIHELGNVTSIGCATNQILKVSGSNWVCADDETGGGSSHNILSATHTDAVTASVVRGDIMYGDATPEWNRLPIGSTGTILKSDGTDVSWGTGSIGTEVTGASTDLTDTADIAYLNTANTYVDGNLQTFTDDDVRFGDASNNNFATLSINELVADRTVTIPALGGNEVFVFQGVSQTLTNKGIDADSNTLTNIDNDEIKSAAGIDWSKISKTGSLFADIGDVSPGCADGAVRKYQESNSTWICATDNTGGSSDIISEGDSSVEVIDAGTGQVDVDIDNSLQYRFSGTEFNTQGNDINVAGGSLVNTGTLTLPTSTDTLVGRATTDTLTNKDISSTTNTYGSIHQLSNVTSTGCATDEILKVSGSGWVCAEDGGSGINDINGDTASSQTLLGTTNQVTVTDTGVGELTFDVGTDVVQIDNANSFANGNMQTFTDDDIRIADLSNDNHAIFSVNELAADRTISIPALGSNDVFVFQSASQTLTNKGIDADTNTLANIDNDEIKSAAGIDASKIADGTVSSTEFQFINTVTSNVQDQLDSKLSDITGESIHSLINVTSTGCTTDQILKVSGTGWVCATDETGGGGSHTLLDGSSHTDTAAQTVSRGSLIYGDSTPQWNELVVGTTNQVLQTDGTDVAWATLGKSHLPSTVVYTDQSNTWSSGTQDFGSLLIQGFDLDCDGTGNSCTNVDTADFIGVAEPKQTTFTCGAAQPQVSASPPKATIDGTNMDYVVCDYSDGVTERLIWTYEMPGNMDSTGNIDITVHFTTTGTAGVCWDVAFRPVTNAEVIDGAFSTLSGGCDSATVTGEMETASITGIASATHGITAGDVVFIKLERDHADATDTNTADARFISMVMEWN